MAKKFKIKNISESRLTAAGGRGSKGGWRRIGITAAMQTRRGTRAFKRRYSESDEGSIELAARV
jgi:hypothetical protein